MVLNNEKAVKFFSRIVKNLCPLIPDKDKQVVIDAIVERYTNGNDEVYNDGMLKLKKSAIAELITLNYGMNTIGIAVVKREDKDGSKEDQ